MSKKEDRPSILDHDAIFDIICEKIVSEGLSMRAITRALALANIRASNGIEEDEKIKQLSHTMRISFFNRVNKNPAREKQYLDAKERRKQIVSMKLDEIIGAAKEEVQDRMFDRNDSKSSVLLLRFLEANTKEYRGETTKQEPTDNKMEIQVVHVSQDKNRNDSNNS